MENSELKKLLQIVPAMLCITGTDGYFKYLNPAWESALGYTLEELLSRPLLEFIHPDDRWTTQREIERQLKGNMTLRFKNRYRCKDGSYKTLEWNTTPAEGNMLFAVARDISEQKRSEEELREVEERYKGIFERTHDFIYLFDFEGSFIDANSAALEGLGYTREDIASLNFSALLDEDQLPRALAALEEILSTGTQKEAVEYRLRRKDGRPIYVESKGAVVMQHGKPVAIQAIARDVTTRRLAEDALKRSEMRFRNLIEGSIQGILIHRDHKPLFVNPAWAAIHGYTPEEILEMDSIISLMSERDRDRMLDYMRARLQGEDAPTSYEYHGVRKDGSLIWLENRVMTVEWDGGPAIQTIIIDISQRKQLESQLKQSQRLESIGTLAGGIAHDFNNILSSIIGFTELALEGAAKGSPLEDHLLEVFTAGKRAKDLVKQILAFARQSDEERKPIRVDTIAKEVLRLIRSTIPTTIDIKEHLESRSLIMGNPMQVHQLFLNLCTNAAQAMEDDSGILQVQLTDVALDEKSKPALSGLKKGNYIKITVSDTGQGISPEVIGSIFEPYFTTKKLGEGTGMGLALVHGIVESYGGKITADSELGKGAVFSVYLPMLEKHDEYLTYEEQHLPSGTEHILFVDDELPIAKMGSLILERLGYRLTVRTSSVEALELFRSKPDDFDLVISDMTMPNMTGDQLAMELISTRSDIPIILCTGYSKRISDETAARIGIKALVYKPVVKADLAKTIRKVLDGHQAARET